MKLANQQPSQHLEPFSLGLAAHEVRIEAQYLAEFASQFLLWRSAQEHLSSAAQPCLFLQARIEQLCREGDAASALHAEFSRRMQHAQANAERAEEQHLILQYAAQLGASPSQLRQDQRALQRWFGWDALQDRYAKAQAERERRLTLALRQLGRLAAHYIRQDQPGEALARWQQLALEATLLPLFAYIGNVQVRIDAFQCLACALASLPRHQQEGALGHAALQFVYRCALDHRLNVWLQSAALELLSSLAPQQYVTVLQRRLQAVQQGDDLFVRRRLVDVLVEHIRDAKQLQDLLNLAQQDPSPFVRQGVALALAQANTPSAIVQQLLPALLLHDVEAKVRGQAALSLLAIAARAELADTARNYLAQALAQESAVFVLRVLLHVSSQCCMQMAAQAAAQTIFDAWLKRITPPLHMLHQAAEYKVRRWAAQAAENIWLYSQATLRPHLPALAAAVASCQPGRSVLLPASVNPLSASELARMLAILSQHDYGLSLEKTRGGWRLWRGDRFGFRFWRMLHEWRHPSPDKRQAFRHTIGRIFRGQIRIPSAILAEMSETKVPGEPLQLDSEAGWRPYLPLADELLSALDEDSDAAPLRIYTAEGVTEVRAPTSLLARIKAKVWLNFNFSRLAHLRNWREESQAQADSYLKQIAKLGFRVRFKPHKYSRNWRWAADPAVARFFSLNLQLPLAIPLMGGEAWARFENYFFSSFDNSLFDLALFTGAGLALFTANHIYQNYKMQRARRAIPLVVGGWGTRGKSGTERIKAALFNALGYRVVSKTTGCEAMFLHGHAYADLREMFLFRPYDKATIWEQHHLVCMSPKLGCDVFLWECMALTPEFVQLLQRSWMRDDISTITNTIPDHEDLQGPAGINIPQVMTNFIGRKGIVVTSEEQMRPILKTAADQLQTRMVGVGWLESGLLAPDVLARFPYQEHPDNIALVLAMGRELGIAPDFALKEMADRVVPDLGVLKTYPVAEVAGRRLSFVNGMSANERFGCIGNWTRLGFHQMDYEAQPGQLISTVVNNRGDRIARSRVFANILVEDLRADYHFLIGSNLAGLQGYIREAWQAHAKGISLWPLGTGADEATSQPASEVLSNYARHMRVIFLPEQLQNQLAAMLKGQGFEQHANFAECLQQANQPSQLQNLLQSMGCAHIQATLAAVARAQQSITEYQAFAQQLQNAEPNENLNQTFRDLLWQWFSRKLVVVEDYYASGDSIIQLLAEQTPPGCANLVMGIQNIKGTGLDFIYCWQAWDACYLACAALQSRDPNDYERGLAALERMQNFGVLSELHLKQILEQAGNAAHLQGERQQAQLRQIGSNLHKALEQVRSRMGSKASSGWLERLCSAVEGIFDAGDAVQRRRKANQIYADLATQRISHSRAAIELQALTQRQKGGWLYKSL